MAIIPLDRKSGIPLIGLAYIGVIARNRNSLLQIRPTTLCNLNCPFCSTDGGPKTKRQNQFVVELSYLLDWVREIVGYYGWLDWAHIDSVGEPFMYPQLVELVAGLKQISGIKKVSMVTNGSLLTRENIQRLADAGLDKINISLHSLDAEKSKMLFGSPAYDVEKVIAAIKLLSKTKIEVWLVPVYLPGVNKEDVEKIIQFAKQHQCRLGIQKYEIHKYGRRMRELFLEKNPREKRKLVKVQSYPQFEQQLREWEHQFGVQLLQDARDLSLQRVKELHQNLKKGELVQVKVKAAGWMHGQSVGVVGNRAVTLLKEVAPEKVVKARVQESNHNIYIVR